MHHAPVGRAVAGVLTRAAIVAVAATALGAAGCSDDSAPTPTTDAGVMDAGNDGGPVAMYGGPPIDASAGEDGGPIAAYGGPPMDAGPAANDSGAAAPAYGAPTP